MHLEICKVQPIQLCFHLSTFMMLSVLPTHAQFLPTPVNTPTVTPTSTPTMAQANWIYTIAGTGEAGYDASQNGGPARQAKLKHPYGLALHSAGTLYLSHKDNLSPENGVIRRMDTNDDIYLVAGVGSAAYIAEATKQSFFINPLLMAVDAGNTLYVADNARDALGIIAPINSISGAIEFIQAVGDPWGIAFNKSLPGGNPVSIYTYVADYGNNRILQIHNGTVSTFYEGNGLIHPAAVAADTESVYVVEQENNGRLLKIDRNTNNAESLGTFNFPSAVVVDTAGNVFVSTFGDHRVYKVYPADSGYAADRIAGTGIGGYNNDGIPANTAQLNKPAGLAIDGMGNLLIADRDNHRIRKIVAAAATPTPGIYSKGAVNNHFPVPVVRNPTPSNPDHYYFPIGWGMFLHDYHEYIDPSISDTSIPRGREYNKFTTDGIDKLSSDWSKGILSTIQHYPWNTVFAEMRSGNTLDIRTRADADMYLNFLRKAGGHSHKLKVFPSVLARRDWFDYWSYPENDLEEGHKAAWSLPAAIGWNLGSDPYDNSDGMLRRYDDLYEQMVHQVTSDPVALQGLGGWMLANEPYAADLANKVGERPDEISYNGSPTPDTWFWRGLDLTQMNPFAPFSNPYTGHDGTLRYLNRNAIRDDLYYRMKYILQRLQHEWDPSDNRPIHATLRGYHNYGPPNSDENKSSRVCDVLYNDHYVWYDLFGQPNTVWRDVTQLAIERLVSTEGNPQAFVQWFDGEAHNYNGAKWVVSDEDLRYSVYSSLIHGTRGIMFWFLSKSEQEAFDQSEKIAFEVGEMAPYLLQPAPPDLNVLLTASSSAPADIDFLVRIHPGDPDKCLLLIANQSPLEYPGIRLRFPDSWQFSQATGILPSYNWSCTKMDENGDGKFDTLEFYASEWWARAFILNRAI